MHAYHYNAFSEEQIQEAKRVHDVELAAGMTPDPLPAGWKAPYEIEETPAPHKKGTPYSYHYGFVNEYEHLAVVCIQYILLRPHDH